MKRRDTILLLEDNAERLIAFQRAVAELVPCYELQTWRDAHRMISECHEFLPRTALISLDHDLNKAAETSPDPGDGLEVATFLARLPPICPVILHTSNTDRLWSMHNEFRFGGWPVENVMPLGNDWIDRSWRPKARAILESGQKNYCGLFQPVPSVDQKERFERALLSLHGLAIGDSVGELTFRKPVNCYDMIMRQPRLHSWYHTDDTEMAISIVEVLRQLGTIEESALAKQFALRYARDPERGYGSGARLQLRLLMEGADWRATSRAAFGGQGSLGNGSAMRVAPLGGWFADDLDIAAKEARASAMVTHMHPEGVAGAVAIAIAAAMAWRLRGNTSSEAKVEFFNEVNRRTPDSETRRGIAKAFDLRNLDSPWSAARELGNGSSITCPDTVPFTVWAAGNYLGKYREAIASTASVCGDADTNCAIVGGIVALSTGWTGLPSEWLADMEELPFPPSQRTAM